MSAAPREVSRRFHDEVINGNDWEVARALLAPDVVHLRGAIGLTIAELDPEGAQRLRALSGAERFIAATVMLRQQFPRWESELLQIVADGEYVFTKCRVRGTAGAGLRGALAGTDFELLQAVVQKVEGGRITEIWALADQLDFWRALGVPAVAPAS